MNIKDFETKPSVGGTPASENKISIRVTEKNDKFPRFLKSFRVLKKFTLKTNNTVNKQKFIYK
jgi:hypothetical protein